MATFELPDLPDDVLEGLKARAAGYGVSLATYLREALTKLAATPASEDVFARLLTREPVLVSDEETVAAIHAERR